MVTSYKFAFILVAVLFSSAFARAADNPLHCRSSGDKGFEIVVTGSMAMSAAPPQISINEMMGFMGGQNLAQGTLEYVDMSKGSSCGLKLKVLGQGNYNLSIPAVSGGTAIPARFDLDGYDDPKFASKKDLSCTKSPEFSARYCTKKTAPPAVPPPNGAN